jgi:hypothetical protein
MNFNLISTDMKRVMSASFSPTAAVIGGMAKHAQPFWLVVLGLTFFGVASQHKHKRAGNSTG